jgi:hypothetical protein
MFENDEPVGILSLSEFLERKKGKSASVSSEPKEETESGGVTKYWDWSDLAGPAGITDSNTGVDNPSLVKRNQALAAYDQAHQDILEKQKKAATVAPGMGSYFSQKEQLRDLEKTDEWQDYESGRQKVSDENPFIPTYSLQDIRKIREKLEGQRDATPRVYAIVPPGGGFLPVSEDEEKQAAKRMRYTHSIDLLKAAEKLYNPSIEKEGIKSIISGFGSGVVKDFASAGISELIRYADLATVAEKKRRGEELNDDERSVLTAYGVLREMEAGTKKSISYEVARGIKDMIPYMVQFAATGGVGSTAKAAITKLLGSFGNKFAGKAIGYTAGALAQTAVLPIAPTDYFERRIGDVTPDGDLVEGSEDGRLEAAFKAGATAFSEVFTEGLGAYMGRPLSWIARKTGPIGKLVLNPVERFAKAAKFDGWLAEYLEELVNSQMQPLLTGDRPIGFGEGKSFDPREQLVTLLTVSAMGGGTYGLSKIYDKADNALLEYSIYDLVDTDAAELKRLAGLDDPNEIATGLIDFVNSNQLSERQNKAAIKYVVRSVARNADAMGEKADQLINRLNAELVVENRMNVVTRSDGQVIEAVIGDGKNAQKVWVIEGDPFSDKTVIVRSTQNQEDQPSMIGSGELRDVQVHEHEEYKGRMLAEELNRLQVTKLQEDIQDGIETPPTPETITQSQGSHTVSGAQAESRVLNGTTGTWTSDQGPRHGVIISDQPNAAGMVEFLYEENGEEFNEWINPNNFISDQARAEEEQVKQQIDTALQSTKEVEEEPGEPTGEVPTVSYSLPTKGGKKTTLDGVKTSEDEVQINKVFTTKPTGTLKALKANYPKRDWSIVDQTEDDPDAPAQFVIVGKSKVSKSKGQVEPAPVATLQQPEVQKPVAESPITEDLTEPSVDKIETTEDVVRKKAAEQQLTPTPTRPEIRTEPVTPDAGRDQTVPAGPYRKEGGTGVVDQPGGGGLRRGEQGQSPQDPVQAVPGSVPSGIKYYKKATNTGGTFYQDESGKVVPFESIPKDATIVDDSIEKAPFDKPKFAGEVIEKGTSEQEYRAMSVDDLVKLKKSKYPNPDITTPMSADEKLLDRIIAEKFSEINQGILEKRKKEKEYGKSNTVFTEDAAAKAREILKRKLGNLNVGIDPEVMMAGIQLAGYHIEAGARKFADFSRAMINDIGEGIRPYLKSFYESIRNWPGFVPKDLDSQQFVSNFDIDNFNPQENVFDRPESSQPDRTNRADAVPGDEESVPAGRETSREGGTGTQKPGEEGNRGRPGGKSGSGLFTPDPGEPGNQPVYQPDQKPATKGNDARDSYSKGSLFGSTEGVYDESGADQENEEGDPYASKSFAEQTARRLKLQKKAEPVQVVIGDLENIKETLPFLLPEQQDDVLKSETRFFSPVHKTQALANGKGFLFTNGTGTGKTYTGLGIVKRFAKQGKKNILIVVPTQPKVNDWANDGKNLFLDIKPLPDTSTGGEGIVVTTYANFRANNELLKRDFDLIIYDECHRLMESKAGSASQTTETHYLAANKDFGYAFRRLTGTHPLWIEERKLNKMIRRQAKIMRNPDLMDHIYQEYQKKLDEYEAKLEKIKEQQESVRPGIEERAKQAAENTKVVFLSATPFKSHFNLRYANGFLFDWGNETTYEGYSRVDAESRFFLDHFGSAYEWKFHRLQTKQNANAEAIALQEVQFAEGLFEKGVMSGRVIESERDYSREFPRVAGLQTNDINQAFSDIYNYEANDFNRLRDAARSVFYDYNYSTQLFESLRTSVSIPRIRKHIELGRKVVVFHRRKQANASPPFAMVLAITRNTANGVLNSELSSQKQKDDAMEALTQASKFESKYASLLEYEKTLNYGSAINQISQAFGDRVVYVNGDITSKKTKSDNIRRFQDDNSGVDIIVVQEESGKEGISLHDQTGNRQRVLMSMSMPISSITALQMEGRIYRIGQETDAIFEYPILGLDMEIAHFGQNINKKLSTTENLAVGDQSRDLIRSFAEGVLFSEGEENPNKQQGIGGKEYDKKVQQAMSDFRKAILVYQSNQKNRRSRGQREGVDYFATPEPLGQKMVEWLDLQVEETALEPSAGHGAIAMWFPSFTNITAIEPAFELYSKLNARSGGGNRKIIQSTFEEHNIVNKYDGIVMNPPFGTAGKTAMNHVEKAFRHLRNGGRLVAIVPAGPSMDKRVDNFLYGKDEKGHTINPEAYLVGDILLPSVTFEQAGTSVNARVLVIDKHIAPLDDQPNFGSIDLRDAKKIGELFERLEFITVPGKEKPQESSPIPNLSLQTTDRGYILPNKTKEVGQFETFTQSHSQTGETLYMANPSIFLARPEYDRINKIAKKHGGYFSSYSSAVKNIKKGFVFKNEESRTKFLNEAGDASVPLSQGTQPKAGMTVQDVRKIVDKINSVAVNPPKIVVVANDTEFPEKIRQLASFKPNHIKAAVYPEAIYMNASMFSNRDQVVGTWVHEVGVHHGMTRLIPDKDIRDGLFRKVWMSANAHAMRGNEEYKKIIRFINENYHLRSNIEAQKGNEFLAYLSDKVIRGDQLTNADRTIWQQFINKMKELLARLFNFNADVLTTNEISNIVRAAVETNFSSRISKDQSIVNEKENKYNFIQTQINWGEEVSFKRPENVASDPGMSEIQREADYSPDHSNSITFAEDQLSDRGYLTFMGDALTGPARIKSANDVAFLFKNLENASTENVFVVHMDDKGKYKVQYLTTGSSVGSIVPIKHIISAAKEFGATRLVMVHNHPSGNLEQSQNDKLIDEQIRKAAEVVGINALPGIIINLDSGKFAMIGDPKSDIQNKIEVTASIKKQKIYSFDRKKLYVPSSDRTVIRESSDIAEFLSKQKRGIVGKVHAIILDQRNSVTKYILYDGNISTDELSKELLPEIGKSGERVVIASSYNLNLDIRELNRLLEYIDSKILDYIIVKQDKDIIRNYESWVDRYGSLGESESKYGNEVAKKRNPMFVGDMLKEEKFDQATRKKLNQIEKEYNETPYKESMVKFGISEKGTSANVAEEPGTELPATITIDGVERSTTNSEGRPIAPTVEGIRNFYRWFGESKVVDAQGRPLVVYHGTRTNFTTFRRGDIGFHFGNKSQARGRVGRGRDAILMPVYLNIKSYADLTTDFGNWEADMDLADNLHEWGVITDEQHAEIESNPVGDYYNGVYSRAARRLVGMIKENGYDGIRYKNRFEAKTAPSFIVFSPSQIKSATGNMGSFDPDNNDIRFRTVSPIGFYSTVENALESIKQGKGTPEQFKAMLLKNGAKQAELDWMDYDGTFTGKSVTKTEIQDWIDQNRIEVKEVEKGKLGQIKSIPRSEWVNNLIDDSVPEKLNDGGDWVDSNGSLILYNGEESYVDVFIRDLGDYFSSDFISTLKQSENIEITDDTTKYSQYTLPGGKNYKELLLTMPDKSPKLFTTKVIGNKWFVIDSDGKIASEPLTAKFEAEEIAKRRTEIESGKKINNFKSSHFDEPNILAHIRFNERTVNGERVLFLEEIQSDWAQKGKKEGFKSDSNEDEYNSVSAELARIKDEKEAYRKEIDPYNESSIPTLKAEYPRMKELDEKENQLIDREYELRRKMNGVPDMPFKQTGQWVNLALRRMMMYAAENGYDRIAWTTGEQQAERYDLSKQVDAIEITKDADGYKIIGRQNGENALTQFADNESDLANIIGKELASKIVNDNIPEGKTKIYEGQDIKVGGEGMKGFYDNIVPAQASKLVKPFGAKLETIVIQTKKESVKVNSIPITESMASSVQQGVPLFRSSTGKNVIEEAKYNALQKFFDKVSKEAIQAGKIHVYSSRSQVPKSLQRALPNQKVSGFYTAQTGESYFILNEIDNVSEAFKAWVHEVGVHGGLRKIIPVSVFNKLMGKIYNDLGTKEIRRLIPEYYWELPEHIQAEEYLAFLAERIINEEDLTSSEISTWRKIIESFKELLNKLFRNAKFTTNDAETLVKTSVQNLFQRESLAGDMLQGKSRKDYSKRGEDEIRLRVSKLEKMSDGEFREKYRDWVPTMTNLENSFIERNIERTLIDSGQALKNLLDEVEKRGVTIGYDKSAYEEQLRSRGKNRTHMEDFDRDFEKPLLEAIADITTNDFDLSSGDLISYRDIEEYLKAKHGLERNEKMNDEAQAKTKGKYTNRIFGGIPTSMLHQRGLKKDASNVNEIRADITYEELTEYLKDTVRKFERNVNSDRLNNLWDKINKATNFTLDRWFSDGFLSLDEYLKLTGENGYKYYVPLRGWIGDVANDLFEYQNKQVGGAFNPNKKAFGRSSEADDTIPYIISMAGSAIVAGNKNNTKRLLLHIARDSRDLAKDLIRVKYFYEVINDRGEWEDVGDARPEQKLFDEKKARIRRDRDVGRASKYEAAQHEVEVFENGEKKIVQLADPQAASAINGENLQEMGPILETLSKFTRFWAALTTSKNPAFIIPNMIRDLRFAFRGIMVDEGVANSMRFMANYGKAQAAVLRAVSGKANMDKKYDKLYQQFRNDGGITGITKLDDIKKIKRKMEREAHQLIEERKKGIKNPLIWVKKLFLLEDRLTTNLAEWSENISRFATYLTYLDMGRSRQESATRAKEITTNFDRRGTWSSGINAAYAFFNARVQGIKRYGDLWKKNPGIMATWTAFDMALGFALAALMDSWYGDDPDEEGTKKGDKVNRFVRHNYLNIPVPGSDKLISIPNPHSFAFFHAIGSTLYDVMSGKMDGKEALSFSFDAFANNLIPIDLGGAFNNEGRLSARPIVPTFFVPIYDLIVNEDYAGRMIYREPFTKDLEKKLSPSQLYMNGTNRMLRVITDAAYQATGGDLETGMRYYYEGGKKKRAWGGEVNPAAIEHILETTLSGKGQFYNQLFKIAIRPLEKNKEPLQSYDIPVVSRFVRTAWGDPIKDKFYDNIREAGDIISAYKMAKGVIEQGNVLNEIGRTRYENAKEIIKINNQIRDINEDLASSKVTQAHKDLLMKKKRENMRKINQIEL